MLRVTAGVRAFPRLGTPDQHSTPIGHARDRRSNARDGRSTVVLALAGTGWASAKLGSSPPGRAVLRNVAGGLLAMVVTYLIGSLVGTQIG